jgi:hypothetical protein
MEILLMCIPLIDYRKTTTLQQNARTNGLIYDTRKPNLTLSHCSPISQRASLDCIYICSDQTWSYAITRSSVKTTSDGGALRPLPANEGQAPLHVQNGTTLMSAYLT